MGVKCKCLFYIHILSLLETSQKFVCSDELKLQINFNSVIQKFKKSVTRHENVPKTIESH